MQRMQLSQRYDQKGRPSTSRSARVGHCWTHTPRASPARDATKDFWAAQKHLGNVPFGVAKAATDKMTTDTAHELRAHQVAVLSLYPGLVRTEKVMEAAAYLDLSNSESPRFIGRAVAALLADPRIMEKSGAVVVAAACGMEYGFTDVDGKQPQPLSLAQV